VVLQTTLPEMFAGRLIWEVKLESTFCLLLSFYSKIKLLSFEINLFYFGPKVGSHTGLILINRYSRWFEGHKIIHKVLSLDRMQVNSIHFQPLNFIKVHKLCY